MFVRRGSSRITFCFPSMGIVVKLPKPKIFEFLKCSVSALWQSIKQRDLQELKWAFRFDKENYVSWNIRNTLLNGIYHNWKEAVLWRETSSPFLEPTLFSLFGLVNIQKYGDGLRDDMRTLWSHIYKISEGEAFSNPHHFSNPNNFSFSRGNLRMVDYGGTGIREIVVKYGEKISSTYKTQ